MSIAKKGKKLSEAHKNALKTAWIKRKQNFPPQKRTEEAKLSVIEIKVNTLLLKEKKED